MNDFTVFLTLFFLGLVFGTIIERKHFTSLKNRERKVRLSEIIYTNMKEIPNKETIKDTKLVVGEVVISIDYFKRVVSGLLNIFGMNLFTYESLLERARREATLRMIDKLKGSKEIYNVIVTTSMLNIDTKQNVGSIEVIVYGNSIIRE